MSVKMAVKSGAEQTRNATLVACVYASAVFSVRK